MTPDTASHPARLIGGRPLAYAVGAALGYAADHLFGDPRRAHPVAAFGRAAAALESRLWRDNRAAGALHTALCAGATVATAALATAATRRETSPGWGRSPEGAAGAAPGPGAGRTPAGGRGVAPAGSRGRSPRVSGRGGVGEHNPLAGPVRGRRGEHLPLVLLTALVSWAVLGGASLRREALGIAHALRAHDLDDARHRLPRLCGRDPHHLGEADIARAVVESVAENTSDAVVGALLCGAVGGVPGLAGFRAVNTLDAMVGHKSARYLRFGWAAARLDDLVGYPGARLTAALATLAGPDPRAARRIWRQDGPRHPSPNAGPVEAAFAGALGLRLGGELSYAGRTEHRAVLNPAGRAPGVHDIERAVRLSSRVSFLALLTTTLAALLPTEASHA
ncbi:cobalamin biosynthesis protein [Streptomyces sp. NBC_01808]|uniref:cobalamin biosynthesis protein n=1 Tax=Streptomyces sp. NBC_01808 TaxID=2975947 RepID=UPI002DD7F259|nr:cobalamin biosynthesis protein [Streptomyces sp. NBC_01808]WSA37075.1 cobalamin biosynthesis protein [Streptomyces sp. NBC_01808]